jgi:hypothetical protein
MPKLHKETTHRSVGILPAQTKINCNTAGRMPKLHKKTTHRSVGILPAQTKN